MVPGDRAVSAGFDVAFIALLLRREQALCAEARDLIGSSCWRHSEIQNELTEIRKQLEALCKWRKPARDEGPDETPS